MKSTNTSSRRATGASPRQRGSRARYAIVRPDQLKRNRPRYADDWVRDLDAGQEIRYVLILDALMAQASTHDQRTGSCRATTTRRRSGGWRGPGMAWHGGCAVCPREPALADALIRLFVLEKALCELRYELENRPRWLVIPRKGLMELTENAP